MNLSIKLTILIFITLTKPLASQTAIAWNPIANSANSYGSAYSNSKPLQYNTVLNMVSFIYPSSTTYSAVPYHPLNAPGNVLVSMLSNNWGTSWDSSCVWNNSKNALYPQAVICNPPGNTSPGNAKLAGVGTVSNSTGANGIWLCSKKIGNGNYTASSGNDTVVLSNTSPFGPLGKINFAQYDLSADNQGRVRGIGILAASVNPQVSGFRGAKILIGTASANAMNWVADSLLPPFRKNSISNQPMADPMPHMAWNDAGSMGYVWFIGCRQNAGGVNSGYQPIVYKTNNSGANWVPAPIMDFTSAALNTVLQPLEPVPNSTLVIPKFNHAEGIDGTVDNFGNLHLVSTIISTAKSHPDSANMALRFLNADGERYLYKHTPGHRPYIYDFTLNGNNWEVSVVDSMSSEAPGTTPSVPGCGNNPWDGDNDTVKLASGARIQLSRTANGDFVVYAWAESDTNFTNGGFKWNEIPNIKARIKKNCLTNDYGSNEVNITNPPSGASAWISSRAHNFYVAPQCVLNNFTVSTNSATFKLPVVVSNNQNVPLTQGQVNTHYYSTASLAFSFPISDSSPAMYFGPCTVGLNKFQSEDALLEVFPNPTKSELRIRFNQSISQELKVQCTDILGHLIETPCMKSEENTLVLSTGLLNRGIYFVRIQEGEKLIGVKKIIKE